MFIFRGISTNFDKRRNLRLPKQIISLICDVDVFTGNTQIQFIVVVVIVVIAKMKLETNVCLMKMPIT